MALPRMPSFSSAKAATRKPLQHEHAPSYALRPTSTVHGDDDDESGRCSRPLKSDDALDGEDLGSGDDDANDEASELSHLEKEVSLEITLERIGMGRYQWRLLFLCGFGWLCDNMYLTTLAVILPRVADEFSLAPKTIATLSSAMMCGMMVGAISWGCSADLLGRTIPFNMTLALTGIFGVLCSYAQSFGTLRLGIFFLGTAVGGSMPTDGTIFLENTPKRSQYLLTGLSVFFSLGATVTSILALSIIPANSCPEGLTASSCDVATQNLGWRWLLRILGLLTLLMCIARLFLFRLHESPRFLVNEGRADEALAVLRRIVAFNDRRLSLDLEDVGGGSRASSAFTHTPVRNSLPSPAASPQSPPPRRDHSPSAGAAQDLDYGTSSQATSRPAESFPFRTPTMEQTHNLMLDLQESVDDDDEIRRLTPIGRPSSRPSLRHSWMDDQRRSNRHPYPRSEESTEGIYRTSGRLFGALTGKIGEIFTPKWRRTTVLMWLIWGATSLAYTMFNAFLPILLEQRVDPASTKGGRTESLEELLLYSLAGCPGALLGAYLIERPTLGRRKTLALLTLATALATLAFSGVTSKAGVIVSSMAISLAGTAMYSVLYGMSPEMYSTSIRGTATGSAAAISRLTGIAAPLLTGFLLPIGPSLALWVSASVFGLSAVCASLLPFERAEDVEDAAASFGEGE